MKEVGDIPATQMNFLACVATSFSWYKHAPPPFIQFRSSSISSAPSKATSRSVSRGRESKSRDLRPAVSITLGIYQSNLKLGVWLFLVSDPHLPRLITCGDELDLGDAGVVERFYGFDYVDDCAAGADAYVADCGVEVVLDGALGGGAFGGFDVGGRGGCGHIG